MKTLVTSTFASLLILSGAAQTISGAAQTTIVNFDDLAADTLITKTTYGGIFWEEGNAGYAGNIGGWSIGGDYPHSGDRNVINWWGSPLTGMSFSNVVNVQSAWFAGQGSAHAWAPEIRVHGYLSGVEVATTGWFDQIDTTPALFNINLTGVDRIVIESVPVGGGGGWFGMDDFTYTTVVPEPTTTALLVAGIGCAALRSRRSKHTAGSTR